FPALVLDAVVETEQAYEVHHIVNVKPALYVAASVLAAELARARRARAPVLATWAGLALGALWVDARAFTDLATAAPPRGLYWGVTWNMSDAWQAAARSPARGGDLPGRERRTVLSAGAAPSGAGTRAGS